MLYGKYQFTCRLDDDALLPPYKGSTFRGVFGHALKRVVCALRRQDCETCILKERCLYVRVFETPLAMSVPPGSRVSAAPHPFVMEPPNGHQTRSVAGERLGCDLILFGETNMSLPYFVYAFEQMGRIGIGRRVNGRRGRFTLESLSCNGQVLYSEKDGILNQQGAAEDLEILAGREEGPQEGGAVSRIRVNLETPLRVKQDNTIQAKLPFDLLVRALLRRASSLFCVHGSGEPVLDYPELVRRAGEVQIVENRLRWYDWRRYSNRQDRKMFMGGMTGSVIYEGQLSEFLPLLEFGTRAHIGKNTTFGLGKISFDAQGSE